MPNRAGVVLATLILVAGVANLNLSVANVALPDIGLHFGSSQTSLDLVAVGFSLGLAGSVLYLGAVGDRYGRKLLILVGMALSIPASLVAGFATSDTMLIVGRVIGGVAAGMAFPTTLALITALWSGPARTKAIATWSALGGALAALGPLLSGWLLENFYWGSVFLITVPLSGLAFMLALAIVPAHVNETTNPVDHLGGLISIVFVGALVLSINFAGVSELRSTALAAGAIMVIALVAFIMQERRARFPLYDLEVASRRVFWVAALAGIIVFGSLMGAMFVGQQYLQNVLGYSPLEAGAAILPAVVLMVPSAPISARMVGRFGARLTLLTGYVFCFFSFSLMLLLWDEGASYWAVAPAYVCIGIGVGLAGTPASNSLTGSVPVERAGMASGTADLQRDLGGAAMQSVMGALLTAGYGAAIAADVADAPPELQNQVTNDIARELESSFAAAELTAERVPIFSDQIVAAARVAFIDGANNAYLAGCTAIVIGFVLVATVFPRHDRERELLAEYEAADEAARSGQSIVAP
ncbi:MAG: MFS transporter [Actinomycetota bacterium]